MMPSGNGRGSRLRALWQLCMFVAGVGFLLPSGNARAQSLPWNDTPQELRPWIPWVLDTNTDELCPKIGEQPVCVWPGLLQLDLSALLGHFRLSVTVDRRATVDLPGSLQTWPQNVQVNGQPGLIIDRNGAPSLVLGRGTHVIEGDFFWKALPETLKIPPGIALISLRRDGESVSFPKRDPELLWLRSSSATADEQQRLNLEVFRRLDDGVPFQVTTRLVLHVAGKAREVNLGQVHLPGSSPLTLESSLPVRLNDDQTLSSQVYAGSHTIDVRSVFERPPGELERLPYKEPWPAEEIWVLVPEPALRQVELVGAPAVDPSRTNLPQDWQRLAAYSVGPSAEVSLVTAQRGDPDTPPNRLQLQRDIWFDLDGSGYTIVDRFTGQMNRDWRLDLLQGDLGRVLVNGEPQLITQNPQSSKPGVELREGSLSMVAEWRTKGTRSEFPAVGWSEDVQQLSASLHVPPGWELINASGVDGLSETWISSWDLFSLFFVLIVSAAIWQLTHLSWGLLALITMVLTHDQPEAPSFLWACIVAAIALLRVVPTGVLRRIIVALALGCVGALFIVLVSFTSSEVRTALFPQTELETQNALDADFAVGGMEPPPAPDTSELESYSDDTLQERLRGSDGTGPAADKKAASPTKTPLIQRQQDPQAVVQTGPGIPTWSWRSWRLDWSGPVHRDHTLRLYLLSASGSGLISGLRVLLCGLLAYLLLGYAYQQAKHPPKRRGRQRAASTAVLLLSVAVSLTLTSLSAPAHADVPRAEVLEELRARLTRKPLCHPNCMSVQRMDVGVDGTGVLTIGSEVHASDESSYQLPGPFQSWAPDDVRVNGTPSAGMVLADDGFLHLRLPPGRYWITVSGPILGNNVTLTLGDKPRWVQVDAPDWEVDGVNASGAVEGSLRFHKRSGSTETEATTAPSNLPSWLLVTRTFKFGVNWSISTQIERLGASGSPIVERFELLPGEKVTRADLVVEDNQVLLSLGRDEHTLSFESVLEVADELFLVAQNDKRLSERWVIQCGPIWHCSTEGIAPSAHQTDGHWEPHFRPWPEDALKITLVRPAPSVGQSLTVDSARLDLQPGKRLLNATLSASVRSSSRNTLSVHIPQTAQVQELLLDGKPHALQQTGGQLGIALDPGSHQLALSWQQPGGMDLFFRAPTVAFGSETANLRVNLQVPEDRWLLFAPALSWGPAVLFWGYLAFIAIMGFVLGRLPNSPLSELQWILLGVGLTQVHAGIAVLIAAWFFVVAYLPKWRSQRPGWYNMAQAGMIWFTLIFLGCLFAAVYDGLLSTPDMQVSGAGSTNRQLSWYLDRSDGELPQPWAISTSLWVWRGAMLAWSLWLAFNLLNWLRWAFGMFARDGLWKKLPKPPRPGPVPAGYPQTITPTPTPVYVPGAQWVVASNEAGGFPPAPVTPRSVEHPVAERFAAAQRDPTQAPPSSRGRRGPTATPHGEPSDTVSDPGPTTLPTGTKAEHTAPAPAPDGARHSGRANSDASEHPAEQDIPDRNAQLAEAPSQDAEAKSSPAGDEAGGDQMSSHEANADEAHADEAPAALDESTAPKAAAEQASGDSPPPDSDGKHEQPEKDK